MIGALGIFCKTVTGICETVTLTGQEGKSKYMGALDSGLDMFCKTMTVICETVTMDGHESTNTEVLCPLCAWLLALDLFCKTGKDCDNGTGSKRTKSKT